jgi:hypothetical protein
MRWGMAKARIVTADGAKVNLEGTPSEIAAVLKEMKISPEGTAKTTPGRSSIARVKSAKTTLPGLIDELMEAKFFTKPKSIGEVRSRLADLGHHYPMTSLSGPLQGHARKRKLRRFKQGRTYVYAQ